MSMHLTNFNKTAKQSILKILTVQCKTLFYIILLTFTKWQKKSSQGYNYYILIIIFILSF